MNDCCPGLRCWLPVALGVTLLGAYLLSTGSNTALEGNKTAAQDWPMLGGTPARNMVNTTDKNVPTQWSIKEGAGKNVKWVAQLGNISYGGPVVAGGKVFVGTNNDQPRDPKAKGDKGVLMCFRESDGKFLWQAVHDKLPSGQENDWPHQGVASAPVVEGGRVYYVSNRCEVICADAEGSGQDKEAPRILWRLDMANDLKVNPRYLANCSPLIVGDLLFVVTGNGVAGMGEKLEVPEPTAPSFLAINKKTGKVAWQDHSPGDKIMAGQWGSPAAAEVNGKTQVVFPGGDGWLYAFEAETGKPIWKFDCNPKDATPYKPGGRGQRSFIVATPAIYDNKVYVGLSQEPDNDGQGAGLFWCVDMTKTGDVSPERVISANPLKTEPNKDSALVWSYGGSKMMGGDRGYPFGRTLSTPAIHEGLLYVADIDGVFYCFDALTGKKYWEEDFKATTWSSPYWVDGRIYIGTDDGEVQICAHGKEKKLLGKVDMGTPIKGPVVVTNGVLYVMTGKQLFAIAAK